MHHRSMFFDTAIEVDLIERYVSARVLATSSLAEICSQILWEHWRSDHAQHDQIDLTRSVDCGMYPMVAPNNSNAGARPYQFYGDESAGWFQLPLDCGIAWNLLRIAFEAICPTFGITLQAWAESGQIEWIDAGSALGACCKRSKSGRIIVCAQRPTTVASLGLLAHELGHALHETFCPGALANTLSTETVAMACERWVMAHLLGAQADLQAARAVYAWLDAREREFVGRHSMLHAFECDIAGRCSRSDRPLATDTINHLWLQHNRAFFCSDTRLPSALAWKWVDVRPLYIRPGTIGAYPGAWVASAHQCSPAALMHALKHTSQ